MSGGKSALSIVLRLFIVAALWLLIASPAVATTFSVNDGGDADDAIAGDGVCATAGGVCTLRAAIREANAFAGADTIDFAVTITLINIASALPTITSDITLNGAGVTVDNTGTGRVIDQTNGALVINGLTITGGAEPFGGGIRMNGATTSLTLANGAVVTGNDATFGGGIFASMGAQITLTGVGTLVTDNLGASIGAGIAAISTSDVIIRDGARVTNHTGNSNEGSGVYVNGAGTTLLVEGIGTSISGNTNAFSGGGIYANNNAVVTISGGAEVTGNDSILSGSGILAIRGAQVIVTGAGTLVTANLGTQRGAGIGAGIDADVFIENGARVTNHTGASNSGGGVFVGGVGATLTVDGTGTSISGNTNVTEGGGIYATQSATVTVSGGAVITENSATGNGGGIYLDTTAGALIVGTSQITFNTAGGAGDAIFQAGGSTNVSNACIVCNGDDAIAFSGGTTPLTLGNNWWGSIWGPYHSINTHGLQCSPGDSLGAPSPLSDYGITISTPSASCSTVPAGNWLTAAIAGCGSIVITPASALGHARTCTSP